jgi:hypothetical protein
MNNPELVAALENGVVNIEFSKSDGTIRKMRATLNNNLFAYKAANTERKQNENTMPVWDMDKSGWRSFRFHQLIAWEPENTD